MIVGGAGFGRRLQEDDYVVTYRAVFEIQVDPQSEDVADVYNKVVWAFKTKQNDAIEVNLELLSDT